MIRLRSIFGNDTIIKRRPEYYDAGNGPALFSSDNTGAANYTFLQLMATYGATDAWDFVNGVYLRARRVAPSGITFTRASVGYAERSDGIWQSFASGVARITDKGLLVEGSRINRALYSRDLTNAAWTATNVTVARNQVGIDGTANSACSLTATAGNGTVLQAVTHASTGRYFSIWVKRITGTGAVEVTLDNGSTWTGVTVTSGWTRVGAAQTLANPTVGVRIVTSGDAVAVDFAQLEDGGFSSSPILVEGTAVTRAADHASVTTLAYTSPNSIFVHFAEAQNTNFPIPINFDDGTNNNRASMYRGGGVTTQMPIASGGATAEVTMGLWVASNQKAAMRVKTADSQGAVNGTLGTPSSATEPAGTLSRLTFGSSAAPGQHIFGYVRASALFPVAVTNAQLEEITT